MFKNEPDLLTRKQCQELLHISKSKMLELIHENKIPARMLAGSFRIEKSDLIEFVRRSPYYNP
jgi:excisionase family DNA binding protein